MMGAPPAGTRGTVRGTRVEATGVVELDMVQVRKVDDPSAEAWFVPPNEFRASSATVAHIHALALRSDITIGDCKAALVELSQAAADAGHPELAVWLRDIAGEFTRSLVGPEAGQMCGRLGPKFLGLAGSFGPGHDMALVCEAAGRLLCHWAGV